MRSYNCINSEERAIIILSVKHYMTIHKGVCNEKLSLILTEMFSSHPSLSFYDLPLLYLMLNDFYKNIINEKYENSLKKQDNEILNDLKTNCDALIKKLKDIAENNNICLASPS